MGHIKWDVVRSLRDQNDGRPNSVCKPNLVKDVRVSVRAIRNYDSRAADLAPHIVDDETRRKEIICSATTQFEILADGSDVVAVYRPVLFGKRHNDEHIAFLSVIRLPELRSDDNARRRR
jgi:hypothetical protein